MHHNNHREIRLQVVQNIVIVNEWDAFKASSVVGDEYYSIPVPDVQQYQTLFSQDGEYAKHVECNMSVNNTYVFRVHREVAAETVTYRFGSGDYNVKCIKWHC